MSYILWYIVVAASTMVMVQGGAEREVRQATQQCSGDACVSSRSWTPLQDLLAKLMSGVKQTMRDAVCGGAGRDAKVRCPETWGYSRTGPVIGSGSAKVSGEDLLPSGSECGQSRHGQSPEIRITNGEDAPLYAYPWMALLGYEDAAKPDWNCAGVLINDRYVLTAAHCIWKDPLQEVREVVTVRLGEHNKATDPDCPKSTSQNLPCAPSPQDIPPEEIILHGSYDQRGYSSDDIALIRLSEKVTMSDSVRPVCVPPADLDVPQFLGSRDALITGWGLTEQHTLADILQVARVPFVNRTTCQQYYPVRLVEGQVCFGGRGYVSSCKGDSGGPVFQTDSSRLQYTVLGVVSYIYPLGCNLPWVPSVYTSVSHYRNWITDHMRP